MKILTCANHKGGTGKSLISSTLAGFLGEKGFNVLVADFDSQGSVSSNLGVDIMQDGVKTITDIFLHHPNPNNVIVSTNVPNVSLIVGNININGLDVLISNRGAREYIFKNWIEDNKKFFDENFTHMIIDTPPNFNVVSQNAFLVADSILLVNDTSMHSIEGSEQFCALWRATRLDLRVGDNVGGFLINRLDMRDGLSKDYLEYINQHPEFSSMVLKTIIPRNAALNYAELEGTTINYKDRKSKSFLAFNNLVDELTQKGMI